VTTHELAKALELLARILRSGPDQPIEEMSLRGVPTRRADAADIPVALTTLVRLADIDKSQWQAFIRENDFPIDVRPSHSSRDVVGKLLRYLEQNPEARRKVKSVAEKGRTKTSPELQRALDFLLKS